jgi:hypothetical protein
MESPITAKLGLRWKALHILEREPVALSDNIIFKLAPNPGKFSQFGVPPNDNYVPQVLDPTIVYHQAVRRLLKQRGVKLEEARFPYRLNLESLKSDVFLHSN